MTADTQTKRIECGDGAAFDNNPKTNAHPRYKGSIEISEDIAKGEKIEISMWVNTAREDGKALSQGDKYLGIRINKVVQDEGGEAAPEEGLF